MVAAVLLAEGLVALDRTVVPADLPPLLQPVLNLGVDGSRGLLSMIGTSTFGAAATAFSITISVIVPASTSYGPRLVGNFMSNRRNQLTLGVLVSTFAYTTLVIRSIRTADDDGVSFVPHFAVSFALLLAILNVVLLILFIDNMATGTRVSSLTRSVSGSFQRAIEAMETRAERPSVDAPVPEGGRLVRATKGGYVTQVAEEDLVEAAVEADGAVVLLVDVGDLVLEGTPVARVLGQDTSELARCVESSVDVGRTHDPSTDVRYAQQQVLEMAVRALSPGTNDPFTAASTIEDFTAPMARLVELPETKGALLDTEGTPRLYRSAVPLLELIDAPLELLRPFIAGQLPVYDALVVMLGHLCARAATPERADRLAAHLDRLLADARDDEHVDDRPLAASAERLRRRGALESLPEARQES